MTISIDNHEEKGQYIKAYTNLISICMDIVTEAVLHIEIIMPCALSPPLCWLAIMEFSLF